MHNNTFSRYFYMTHYVTFCLFLRNCRKSILSCPFILYWVTRKLPQIYTANHAILPNTEFWTFHYVTGCLNMTGHTICYWVSQKLPQKQDITNLLHNIHYFLDTLQVTINNVMPSIAIQILGVSEITANLYCLVLLYCTHFI